MADRFRRRFRLSLVALAVVLLPLHAIPAENPYKSFVLDNGLQVFLYEKHELPLINVVTGVNVGSKDETDETSGFVHILEHCILFAGTSSRSGDEVVRDVRSHGAYFNASTGQDLSLYTISLPAEHVDFALANQKDVLFNFAVTAARLDEEKAVILEEISQNEDDPQRYATDLLFRKMFEGHPYGHSVYGRRETVGAATLEGVTAFYARYFVPDNCALAIVGDFLIKDMEEKVRAVFGTLKKSNSAPVSFPTAGLLRKTITAQEERDVKEAYVAIGFAAPDYNSPDQYAMDVLTEVMGRGINPMLNGALNTRQDLIKTMNMMYFANRFGGAVVVALTLDPKNAPSAIRDATGFLKRAYGQNFSPDDIPPGQESYFAFDFLGSAKNQIRFASEQADESGLVLAEALARHMIVNTRKDGGSFLDRVAKIDSGDLRKAASQYFSRGDYAVVTIVPRKKDAKEAK